MQAEAVDVGAQPLAIARLPFAEAETRLKAAGVGCTEELLLDAGLPRQACETLVAEGAIGVPAPDGFA